MIISGYIQVSERAGVMPARFGGAVSDKKIYLSEKEIPEAWYNIQADLPQPLAPPLNPKTGQPLGPEDLLPIFSESLIRQEMSTERWIEIPDIKENR